MSKMKIKLHESFSETTLFYGKDGLVVINPAYPGIFAYYMLDEDGKSDDCTYYFKLEESKVTPIGFHAGTDEWDTYFFKTKQDGWLNEDTWHTPEYRDYLLKKLQNLIHVTY